MGYSKCSLCKNDKSVDISMKVLLHAHLNSRVIMDTAVYFITAFKIFNKCSELT